MKMLIVDDEPLVLRSLQKVFEKFGHSVTTAPDGTSGLKAWMESQYDVVVLDVLMPGLTGPQMIQNYTGTPRCAIVLMSAYSETLSDDFKSEYDLFLSKPFENIFDLVKKIEDLVNARRR